MKRRTILAFLLLAATVRAAVIDDRVVAADLAVLAERNVISNPVHWREHLAEGGRCDGADTAALLRELAGAFRPATNLADAVATLAAHGVIGSADYWTKNAVPGGRCEPGNVAVLLGRLASRLPLPTPRSASAAPLAATPAGKLRDKYDIVIAGAGTGGCGAAIQAARMGRSVLLLEETDWIGGQMNAAAVTSMDEGRTLVRERGLYRELCGLIAAHYGPLGIDYQTAYWHGHVCVEPRVGRELLHKMLGDARGSGVLDLALRTRVAGVSRRGDTVTGVEIASAAEQGMLMRRVGSTVLIDATEWGDVIPLTGARYRAGNTTSDALDRSRRIQDFTWTAVVKQYPQGVPPELRVTNPPPGYDKLRRHFERTLQNGPPGELGKPPAGVAWTWDRFIGYRGMPDSSRPPQGRAITRTHLNFNNDYPATVADIEDPAVRSNSCRAAVAKTLGLLHYIQTALGHSDWSVADDEGYATPFQVAQIDAFLAAQPDLQPFRAILVHFPVMPYARESRRIIGLHTLVAREIERKTRRPVQFPDTVALGDYAVDLHGSMTPPYLELDLDSAEDIPHEFGERGIGPFAIPFACFIPETIDGFLPAEKNISQSRLANGATRLQPHTLLMGQAAGAIAALAVQQGLQPRAVNPREVQRILLDAGCTLAIERVKAPWGGAEWKRQQLDALR